MSVPANTYTTYSSIGQRESLDNLISMISPTETPFLSRFKKGKATAKYEEWQTDALDAATDNALAEGDDYSSAAAVPTTRLGNWTQTLSKVFRVSESDESVDKAGRTSEVAYQTAKKLKELARDIEYALVNGTGNSGASGTARRLKGVLAWITTSSYSASGSALTETMFLNRLQDMWNNGATSNLTAYAGGDNRKLIDAWVGNNTRYMDIAGKKIVNMVSVYESSFGLVKTVLQRYLTSTQKAVAILDDNLWEVRTLRPTKVVPLAKTGDSDNFAIRTELTLVARNQAGNGQINGLAA